MARRQERTRSRRPRSRKTKTPHLLRKTELGEDPRLYEFNFKSCSDEQLRVLIGAFNAWRSSPPNSSASPTTRSYWPWLRIIAVTRMHEVRGSKPVVAEMSFEELEAFAFLLASYKNVEDLTRGIEFGEEVDLKYKKLFNTNRRGWDEVIASSGPKFLPFLTVRYQESRANVFGIVIADDYPDPTEEGYNGLHSSSTLKAAPQNPRRERKIKRRRGTRDASGVWVHSYERLVQDTLANAAPAMSDVSDEKFDEIARAYLNARQNPSSPLSPALKNLTDIWSNQGPAWDERYEKWLKEYEKTAHALGTIPNLKQATSLPGVSKRTMEQAQELIEQQRKAERVLSLNKKQLEEARKAQELADKIAKLTKF